MLKAEGTRFLGGRESITYSCRAGVSGFKGTNGVLLYYKRLPYEVIINLAIIRGRACSN
jgi:hypothetical protein